MSEKEQKPLDLLPKEPPKGDFRLIPLSDLPRDIVCPEPRPAFVRSVERLGVIKPIALVRHGAEAYRIADGKRRVVAARRAGLDQIRAIVYESGTVAAPVLTIGLNELRSSNPIAELEALRALVKKGASESDIARDTGMSVSRIRRRLRLAAGLTEPLWDGVKGGKIALGVAERITKLPPAARDRLADKLEETDTVTAADVEQERRARVEKGALKLPDDVFAREQDGFTERAKAALEGLAGEAQRLRMVKLSKALSGALELLGG